MTTRPLCSGHLLEVPPPADYQVVVNDGTARGFTVAYCAGCAAWAVEFGHARTVTEGTAIWGSLEEVVQQAVDSVRR